MEDRRRDPADRDRAGAARLAPASGRPDPGRRPGAPVPCPGARAGGTADQARRVQFGRRAARLPVRAGSGGTAGAAARRASGLHPDTPEPAERVVTTVPNGRLVGSVIVSGATGVVAIALAAVLFTTILPATARHVTTAGQGGAQVTLVTGSTLLAYLIGAAAVLWRRLSSQYGFTVAESGDGIRIRRGLLSTVAETIPVRRVQAVRMIEPLLWRPFGWCRVEVDVAGHPGRDEGSHADRVKKALLPVGPPDLARRLVHTAAGYVAPQPSRPPRRARLKAPLSYHFLAAGHDDVGGDRGHRKDPPDHGVAAAGEDSEHPARTGAGAAPPAAGYRAPRRRRAARPRGIPRQVRGRGTVARRRACGAERGRPRPRRGRGQAPGRTRASAPADQQAPGQAG